MVLSGNRVAVTNGRTYINGSDNCLDLRFEISDFELAIGNRQSTINMNPNPKPKRGARKEVTYGIV